MRKSGTARSRSETNRRRYARWDQGRGGRIGGSPAGIVSGPEDLDVPVDGDIRVKPVSENCHYLTLMVDGNAVSWAGVWDYRQIFGRTVLRVGGVGGVQTVAEHRGKGYARRVMGNSLRWMRGEGFDIALLFGIPGFYPQFGYAPVIPEKSFTMKRSDLRGVRSSNLQFVTFASRYLHAILRMHNRSNAARTGTLQRDPKTWRVFRKGVEWGTKVICKIAMDGKGRVVGYFVYERGGGAPVICEVAFAAPSVIPDILAGVREIARRRGTEEITFYTPEDDSFAAFCKPLGMIGRIQYRSNEKALGRMVNIPSALGKLAPMLAERMTGSGRITIRTNLDSVSLSWSRGRMTVGPALRGGAQVWTPQWALCQMLYGYRAVPDLVQCGVLKASAEGRDALGRMFPPGPQFFYCIDEF